MESKKENTGRNASERKGKGRVTQKGKRCKKPREIDIKGKKTIKLRGNKNKERRKVRGRKEKAKGKRKESE